MIEITQKTANEAVALVMSAMQKMDEYIHTYGLSYEIKKECANTIAALAATLCFNAKGDNHATD